MESQKKVISIPCPYCGMAIKMNAPTNPGSYKISCVNDACRKEVKFNFKGSPTPPPPPPVGDDKQDEIRTVGADKNFLPDPGKLFYKRLGGLKKVEYILKPGDNIIGRADASAPSDFEISGDNAVSRQSVRINVEHDKYLGYKFCLEVMKTTNPVVLNDRTLTLSDKIYLKYGDTITLGKTIIYFNQSNKK